MKNFNSGKIIQNIILIMLFQLIAFNLHAQYSLFSDVKAKKVGDIITVVLQESSQGSSTTDSRNISTNSLNANGGLSGNFLPFEPLFGSDAQFQSNSDASNLATQRQLLEGFLSVQVQELTPVGDLLVEGNITASGDISASNLILDGGLFFNGDQSIQDISGLGDLDIKPGDLIENFEQKEEKRSL